MYLIYLYSCSGSVVNVLVVVNMSSYLFLRSMSCVLNPLILPRSSQVRLQLVRSMTTPPFPNFRLFQTHSQHPLSERRPTPQKTSTLMTCRDALRSSRRRPKQIQITSEHIARTVQSIFTALLFR